MVFPREVGRTPQEHVTMIETCKDILQRTTDWRQIERLKAAIAQSWWHLGADSETAWAYANEILDGRTKQDIEMGVQKTLIADESDDPWFDNFDLYR